ncbi:MAG: hypothetical protein IT341_06885 [Chloroflexi bacterium]|nr:hypothetical protein [Chloroflexota bacterium]
MPQARDIDSTEELGRLRRHREMVLTDVSRALAETAEAIGILRMVNNDVDRMYGLAGLSPSEPDAFKARAGELLDQVIVWLRRDHHDELDASAERQRQIDTLARVAQLLAIPTGEA